MIMVIDNEHRFSWNKLRETVRSALFFILFFLLLWLWVDPKLIYHGHGQYLPYQIYVPGMRTFTDAPAFPGQVAAYFSARLSHYYYFSWAGALIVTIIAWLLFVAADSFITTVGDRRWRPLRFVPPILLLMQYGQYYHYLADSLSLLIAMLFLYLYIRMPLKNTILRFVMFLVFSAVMYAVAVNSYLVFVVLCGIFEFFNKRHWTVGLLCLLSVSLIPLLVNTLVFDLRAFDAYRRMLPYDPEADFSGLILKFSLFLFFPIAGFCCSFCPRFTPKLKSVQDKFGWARRLLHYYRRSKLKWSLETLLLLIVVAGALLFTCDRFARRYLRISYFANNKMWPELLREARRLPLRDYSRFVIHDVNRALYHMGQLASEMFSYPQHFSGLLLPPEKSYEADTLYELGHINRAEDAAYARLVVMDYNPAALQQLALINIVKGQTDAARTFLNALSKDFLYKDWAKRYLAKLKTDPLLSTDEHIQQMRSLMLVEDGLRRKTGTTDDFYLTLLQRNNRNRMAFEYLMAWYLLNGQLDKFVHNLDRLDDFNYPGIPRHYEEAILLYTAITGRVVALSGRRIKDDTIRRFADFMQRLQRYKYDIEATEKMLAKDFNGSNDFDDLDDFEDTYYCYYLLLGPRLAK